MLCIVLATDIDGNAVEKGALDKCAPTIVAHGDIYACELASPLSVTLEMSESAIYPLKRHHQAESWASTYMVGANSWSPRKYYSLTGIGR